MTVVNDINVAISNDWNVLQIVHTHLCVLKPKSVKIIFDLDLKKLHQED